MTQDQLKKEIFSRFGAITRARGCFLYTKKGVRLTDLYQEGGRAVLGWGIGDAFTRFKNILNRGITGTFITEYDSGIDKAVSELLSSDYTVFFVDKISDISDFFFWEPWNDSCSEIPEGETILFKPPFPWTDNFYMICVPKELALQDSFEIHGKIDLPAPFIAAITRSVYDLIQAIKDREEKDWFVYDKVLLKFFTREGPYLYPKVSEKDYDEFVVFCLENGIVINPCFEGHSIVPFGADRGVFNKLKNDTRGEKYAAG